MNKKRKTTPPAQQLEPTSSHSKVDEDAPLQSALLATEDWDTWEEAELFSVVRYCRGSMKLNIPSEWQAFDNFARCQREV